MGFQDLALFEIKGEGNRRREWLDMKACMAWGVGSCGDWEVEAS